MRDQAFKAVGVAFDPIDHVAAVAGAKGALAVFVNEWISLLGKVEAFHQVFVGRTAPVAIDGVNEFLAVTGRAVEVDEYNYIAAGGKEFSVPAIAPLITHRNFGATVDDELYGIFFV